MEGASVAGISLFDASRGTPAALPWVGVRLNRESPWIPIAIAVAGVLVILAERPADSGAQPIGVNIAAFAGAMVLWLYGCVWVGRYPRRRETFVGN